MQRLAPLSGLACLAFLSLLPAAACQTSELEPNATLADLPDLHLRVGVSDNDRPVPVLRVSLAYDYQEFSGTHHRCAVLHDVTGDLDGEPLSLERGGAEDDPGGCPPPVVAAPVGPSPRGVLRLSDRSHTITLAVDPRYLEPHVVTRVPDDWRFAAGDPIAVRISPPLELTPPRPTAAVLGPTALSSQDDFTLEPPVITGDTIAVTLPSPLPRTGPSTLALHLGSYAGTVLTCEGATRCSFERERRYEHPIELLP